MPTTQIDDATTPAVQAPANSPAVHYVLSTHWDREWYQTFQDYRRRLVALLDGVLPALEDGRLLGPFTCDGQAIILEDYLEIRREERPRVEALARGGQLSIGPWYVMPDEFLVSGESLIRNLQQGRQVARELGAVPSAAGFVNDIFGHISQLPQIFAGFGLLGGLIWRGTNCHETRWLRWRGADGTELPCYRFFDEGYGAYAIQVRKASDFTHVIPEEFDPARPDHAERFQKYVEREIERCAPLPALIFDGSDHLAWDPASYAEVRNRITAANGAEAPRWSHGTLDDYLRAALAAGAAQVPAVLEGELREPARYPGSIDGQWLIPGVLSSRVWIKQDNARCETLLCQWAEPLGVLGQAALGVAYPAGYLRVAWRWLLQNHPHDSICGCSIDAVHEDMKFRFAQAARIAEGARTESARQLTAAIEGEIAEDGLRLAIFNPLPTPLHEVVELALEIPSDWPNFHEWFGYEAKPAFRLFDAQGNELPYQRLTQTRNQYRKRIRARLHPQATPVTIVQVALELEVPALGYTSLRVARGEAGQPTRHPAVPGLATSRTRLANEFLALEVASNGTLILEDLTSGEVYPHLLAFEDMADIGDGWYHAAPVNDAAWVSTAAPADVALVHDGPLQATLRIKTRMQLPARFDYHEGQRVDETAELLIDSRVTLRQGARRVEVETVVHNTVQDHRLRVLFPSGARGAETYFADGAYDVLERSIKLRHDNHLYREAEIETKPQRSWTAVHDGRRGLAIVAGPGLLETAVRDDAERTLALTLFRATCHTVMTPGEPNGELLGPLRFSYAIVPLAGELDRAGLCQLGQRLAAGILAVQQDCGEQHEARQGTATLPTAASGLSVEGPVVVTSLTQSADGPELRLFNPGLGTARATLRAGHLLGGTLAQALPVNLESVPQGDGVPAREGRVEIDLPPKAIRTLRLILNRTTPH